MIKFLSAMAMVALTCTVANAAPMMNDSSMGPVVETAGAGNRNSTSTLTDSTSGGTDGTSGALPEPASMALLGIGLGLAGLARRKK